ncbi:porphyrin biosynthesis [Synechococcus phage S-ShM2]|uniref:CobS n=3 Tax=Ahtivirus sagseatwo TaxID=2734079 RepID=A0A1D7SJ86_9CAUD|nr:porphyrin biosynthesis [Synechococcus phage S-ShM2]AGH57411.1 CobS [Cyanophage S-SSM2]AOO13255.1 CobS [Cyanophage S-RIM14]ADO97762.1 putative cobalt chelatase subunit CobS [Synechococcus phage S-ShM2]AOO13471.1 CobS [Cyanophage S-RIM14]AOO13687.1 CobS [Cyanophage S-RIM14]
MPAAQAISTEQLVEYLQETVGSEFTSKDLATASAYFGVGLQTITKRVLQFKTAPGKYSAVSQINVQKQPDILIPKKNDSYVPFGPFQDIKKVIRSGEFYPIFISGFSGNGKTYSVEQSCAQLGRELIRVNITIETDEDDLLGGFRLVDGNTVWHNGPVIEALERGSILLLDEIDLASNKILCLQSILEGSGVFLKKIGKYVNPAEGFNVIATANTKGKGSDDGRFIGTNILNEAFLERFPITFEQDYPTATVENKILLNRGCDAEFAENLIKWAGVIRKTFFDGGVDEVITTRRLVHIVEAYKIFDDRVKAITLCVNRFDDDTKQSFLDLYTKVDAGLEGEYTGENSNLLND